MSQENNVIQFPVKNNGEGKSHSFNSLIRSRSARLSVLFMLLFALPFVNQGLLIQADSTKVSGRHIASVGDLTQARQTHWEHELAQALAKSPLQLESQVGRQPSSEDKFRYEVLNSQYSLQYDNGLVRSIRWFPHEVSQLQPKGIPNRKDFLVSHGQLFAQGAQGVESFGSSLDVSGKIEKYRLLDKDQSKLADVEIHLDSQNRLLSMTVEAL